MKLGIKQIKRLVREIFDEQLKGVDSNNSTVSEHIALRRIIRNIVREQTAKPGGATMGSGGSLSPKDKERNANMGFLGVDKVEELDEEEREIKSQ